MTAGPFRIRQAFRESSRATVRPFSEHASCCGCFGPEEIWPKWPLSSETAGPFRDTPGVRGSAEVHSEEFKECVTLQAQYTLDRFGKFPGTVPSILGFIYLQAHHLDLEFYDRHFKPGAYLRTHARHMERWHPRKEDTLGRPKRGASRK